MSRAKDSLIWFNGLGSLTVFVDKDGTYVPFITISGMNGTNVERVLLDEIVKSVSKEHKMFLKWNEPFAFQVEEPIKKSVILFWELWKKIGVLSEQLCFLEQTGTINHLRNCEFDEWLSKLEVKKLSMKI
jgi:hypothetical protein